MTDLTVPSVPVPGGAPGDQHWIDRAVQAACDNVAAGGGPFGALVVRGDEVLGTGVNQVVPALDPTAHAEVVAIRAACARIEDFRLTGCVLVCSCEPCPLCLSAALWARVERVIYAADRHDAADAGFDDRAFYEVFDSPREVWPLRVEPVTGGRPVAPFDAWRARPDRVEY